MSSIHPHLLIYFIIHLTHVTPINFSLSTFFSVSGVAVVIFVLASLPYTYTLPLSLRLEHGGPQGREAHAVTLSRFTGITTHHGTERQMRDGGREVRKEGKREGGRDGGREGGSEGGEGFMRNGFEVLFASLKFRENCFYSCFFSLLKKKKLSKCFFNNLFREDEL